MVFAFAAQPTHVPAPLDAGCWRKLLSSRSPCWQGPGDAAPEQLEAPARLPIELPGPVALLYQRTR
jgi:hypothetical protein